MKVAILFLSFSFALIGRPQEVLTVSNNPESGTYPFKGKEVNASGIVEPLSGKVYLKNGKIYATFSKLNGFKKAVYTVTYLASSNVTAFSFTAVSLGENGAQLSWTGSYKDGVIRGSAERDDTGSVYHFKGKRQ